MERIIIVGSGFSGSVIARKIAEELNRRVVVAERRGHIAGNMYDEYDDRNILIQRYGPHFLNSDKYWIFEFLQQYGELFPHCTKLLSHIDGRYVRLPFNFQTVQQLLGPRRAESLLRKLRTEFHGRDRVPILELVEHTDAEIRDYGSLLFEKAYRTYISKMWGTPPEQIDKYVLERVPMALNYDERYLNRDFQYLPLHGYTKMFESMLSHPNIEIRMNTDALQHMELDDINHAIRYDGENIECLVFTGAIDELFGGRYGPLPYRSLNIRYNYYEEDSVLPSEIVSYPQAKGYTRSTEYRKIMYDDSAVHGSVVATEYPTWYAPLTAGNEPFYPVVTEESKKRYERYLGDASKFPGLFLCGRLAEFRYYNMDVCIEHALTYYENIKAYLEKSGA